MPPHPRSLRIPLLLASVLLAGDAAATTIRYAVANVSGSTFEYTYLVENDSLGVAIEEFAILFDADLFENLAAAGAPADWDPLLVQPDPILGDDGFVDLLASSAGSAIAPGGSLGGFTVQADFLGLGAPGSQFFEIRDPVSFALLDSGFTIPIPEPTTGVLLALGLALLARTRRSTSA